MKGEQNRQVFSVHLPRETGSIRIQIREQVVSQRQQFRRTRFENVDFDFAQCMFESRKDARRTILIFARFLAEVQEACLHHFAFRLVLGIDECEIRVKFDFVVLKRASFAREEFVVRIKPFLPQHSVLRIRLRSIERVDERTRILNVPSYAKRSQHLLVSSFELVRV